VTVAPELRAWLTRPHADAPDAGVTAREPDAVVERLVASTRALRPRRAEVAGWVVLHHPNGAPFAAVCDGRLLVHASAVPGTLGATPVADLPGWVALDPYPPDVAFARGADVLRDVLTRAFERAGTTV
jgi:hypothetical protein